MPITSREERAAQRRQIAARVREHVQEEDARRKSADPDADDYTVRQLSLACGWDGSHLGTVLRRLELGKDTRGETLRTIATTIGRPVSWLETGEMPEGILVADLPGWAEAAAGAIDRFRLEPAAVEAIGRMRVPVAPRRLDAHVVAQLARAWQDAT